MSQFLSLPTFEGTTVLVDAFTIRAIEESKNGSDVHSGASVFHVARPAVEVARRAAETQLAAKLEARHNLSMSWKGQAEKIAKEAVEEYQRSLGFLHHNSIIRKQGYIAGLDEGVKAYRESSLFQSERQAAFEAGALDGIRVFKQSPEFKELVKAAVAKKLARKPYARKGHK
jgi:hypothetical protein